MDSLTDTLVSQIYRTALDALSWADLLEGIRTLFDAELTALLFPGRPPLLMTPFGEAAGTRQMTPEAALISPHLQAALQSSTEPTYMAAADSIPLPWHRLAIAIDPSEEERTFVVCLRRSQRPAFSGEESGLAKRLSGHFATAHGLARRVMPQCISRELVSQLHFAFLCLDQDGQALCRDERMQAILDRGTSLQLGPGGLTTPDPNQSRRLRQLLRSALAADSPSSGMVQITSGDGLLPLTALVMPAHNAGFAIPAGRTAAWVIVCIPEELQPRQVAAKAGVYGLTEAETRLVHHLLNGLNVHDCAKALEVTPNTVRWHLKRVFHKTGVTSQTALIRTFLSCPILRIPPP